MFEMFLLFLLLSLSCLSSASICHPVSSESLLSAAEHPHASVEGKPLFLYEQRRVSQSLQVLQLTICRRTFAAGPLVIHKTFIEFTSTTQPCPVGQGA